MQYRGKKRQTGKGNRFWQPTHWFTLESLGDRQFTPKNSWVVVRIKRRKKSHPHHRGIHVTRKLEHGNDLYGLRKNYLEVYPVLNSFFLNSWNYPLRRVVTMMLQMQLYLNSSPQWIFFFKYSRNLKMFFLENTSEKLTLQLFIR